MSGDLFKRQSRKIVKMFISNNSILFNGNCYYFNNYDELEYLITSLFMNNSFNIITIFKKIVKNDHYSFVKCNVIESSMSEIDLYVICDKEYLDIFKQCLKSLGFNISKTKELKKK